MLDRPWFNQRAIVRSGEFSGTLDIKSKKQFIGIAARSSERPYICEYHLITPRPITGTTTELPIQDVATTPIDRVDPILVQEPSEPAMTPRTESTHSSSAKSSELDRKETVPSSASIRLTKKSSSETTTSTTATTASTTTTAATPTTTAATPTTTAATSTTRAPTSTTTGRQTSSQPPAESSRDIHGTGKGMTKQPPSRPSTTSASTTPSTTSTTTSTTTSQTSTSTSRTTSTRRQITATRTTPRPTPGQADYPTPAPIRWEEAYKPYEGCYVQVTGNSLMQIVLAARELYADGSRRCPRVTVGGRDWPGTVAGQTAKIKCQTGQGFATWACSGQNITCWKLSPDITDCASKKLRKLLKSVDPDTPMANATQTEAPPTAEETISVTSELLQVTRSENTTREDVLVTSLVITKLTESLNTVQDVKKKDLDTIVDNVVKVGSSLVSEEKSEVWKSMTQEDKVSAAATLLVAIETAMLSTVEALTEPMVIEKKEDNIELKLQVVDVNTLTMDQLVYESESDSATVSIPKETLMNFGDGKLTKAVFITHYSMSSLLGGPARKKSKRNADQTHSSVNEVDNPDEAASNDEGASESKDGDPTKLAAFETRPRIASHILSASLGNDGHFRKLPKPITFTMKLTEEMEHDQIALCSFWNTKGGDNLGFWSQEGCKIVVAHSNKSHTTCQCDHMTSFSILLDVHGLKV
ncbi:hypothetical protein Btru_029922 [Bulinus truncatus]|nr:hypothetical protein Btru_029922 [Bulinus truncatus]